LRFPACFCGLRLRLILRALAFRLGTGRLPRRILALAHQLDGCLGGGYLLIIEIEPAQDVADLEAVLAREANGIDRQRVAADGERGLDVHDAAPACSPPGGRGA
jgi:hypothetical protein